MSNNTRKILIIDDMSLGRLNLKQHLTSMGFSNVTLATQGLEGWHLISKAQEENAPFELIISDWIMPEMDGLELLEKIKSSGWEKRPPLVLVTMDSDISKIALAIKAGISGYIRKPNTQEDLKDVLQRLLFL